MKLQLSNISKTYKNGVRALDDVNLDIKQGMFGLLGPNGAGKSSLMRTIATLQLPDRGTVSFNGINVFENKIEFRKDLGYLPQEFGVFPKDTAEQLLNYFAVLKGIVSKKVRSVVVSKALELTNLENVRNKRVSTFSGGMKRRFGIAQLLLNDPKLIIVDEPTAGLDPEERSRFLNVLRNIGSENIVIFSTHLVEDVRELCHELTIIKEGKILIKSSPSEAIKSLRGCIWETALSKEEIAELPVTHTHLSERFNESGQSLQRIFSKEQLNNGFTRVAEKLEDFYFMNLKSGNQ